MGDPARVFSPQGGVRIATVAHQADSEELRLRVGKNLVDRMGRVAEFLQPRQLLRIRCPVYPSRHEERPGPCQCPCILGQPVEKVLAKLSSKERLAFSPLSKLNQSMPETTTPPKRGRAHHAKEAKKRHTWPLLGKDAVPIRANYSRRLRSCPAARIRPSQFTRHSLRKRKRRIPCPSFPSANSGSTQTLCLRRAFL